ncbi:MAG TPA: hypothetical protein VK620_38080 [Bradyrhizobium sp.]|jgi:hypothetical protein|nr:hypothetical protein [Bradyrhizobium sp.]
MDEDQQFFDVLTSLKRHELIELIVENVPMRGDEFFTEPLVGTRDLDKLGEQVGRIAEIQRGGIVRKGVVMNQASIWRRVTNEMNLLLCTKDKKYAAVRSKLSKESGSAHTAIVGTIAAAVGAQLGLVSGLVVPLVALVWAYRLIATTDYD